MPPRASTSDVSPTPSISTDKLEVLIAAWSEPLRPQSATKTKGSLDGRGPNCECEQSNLEERRALSADGSFPLTTVIDCSTTGIQQTRLTVRSSRADIEDGLRLTGLATGFKTPPGSQEDLQSLPPISVAVVEGTGHLGLAAATLKKLDGTSRPETVTTVAFFPFRNLLHQRKVDERRQRRERIRRLERSLLHSVPNSSTVIASPEAEAGATKAIIAGSHEDNFEESNRGIMAGDTGTSTRIGSITYLAPKRPAVKRPVIDSIRISHTTAHTPPVRTDTLWTSLSVADSDAPSPRLITTDVAGDLYYSLGRSRLRTPSFDEILSRRLRDSFVASSQTYSMVSPSTLTQQYPSVTCQIIFWIFGCCAGFFWEEVLNCLPTITTRVFVPKGELEGLDISGSLTSVFNTAIFVAAALLVTVSPLNKLIVYSGTIGLLICSIAVGYICQLYAGSLFGVYALIGVGIVSGLCTGLTESGTFAYGLCLHPSRLAGCFSTGFGLSGILSFAFWSFFSRALFTSDTFQQALSALWGQQLVSAAIGGISAAAFFGLQYLPEYTEWHEKRTLEESGEQSHPLGKFDPIKPEVSCNPAAALTEPLIVPVNTSNQLSTTFVYNETLTASRPQHGLFGDERTDGAVAEFVDEAYIHRQQPMSALAVMWVTRRCQWHLCLVLGISYAVVPNLIPLALHQESRRQDLLIGLYQICDFCGRCLATQGRKLAWVEIPEAVTANLSYARLLLFAAALIALVYPDNLLVANFSVQIVYVLMVGITNGWFLTLFMMYLGNPLKNDEDKSKATAISVMTQLLGVVAGLYITASLKYLYYHLEFPGQVVNTAVGG